MFSVRRCSKCQGTWKRSDCVVEPEGLFGKELLCPRCGMIVNSRLTVFGWFAAILGAVTLSVAMALLIGARI